MSRYQVREDDVEDSFKTSEFFLGGGVGERILYIESRASGLLARYSMKFYL